VTPAPAARPARAKTGLAERVVQDHISAVAGYLGLAHYHTEDSRGSDAGFLDSFLIGPGGPLVIEAKDDDGKTTPEQELWRWLFTEVLGITVLIRRPEHTRNDPKLGGKTQIQVDLEAIARGPGGTRFPRRIADLIVTIRSAKARKQVAAITKAAARRR
jgi:hypothetical protein